jgi:hypothetical protein
MVQQCTAVNISVGMKETRCGPEPIYKEFTVGKDGFSLRSKDVFGLIKLSI